MGRRRDDESDEEDERREGGEGRRVRAARPVARVISDRPIAHEPNAALGRMVSVKAVQYAPRVLTTSEGFADRASRPRTRGEGVTVPGRATLESSRDEVTASRFLGFAARAEKMEATHPRRMVPKVKAATGVQSIKDTTGGLTPMGRKPSVVIGHADDRMSLTEGDGSCVRAGRPKNNKGSGGSRDFIPWCQKGKGKR